MRLVKGMLMGVGALALVASLANFIAPKAVHAAVAALVQVANTPTTAVPTVLAPAAGQLYSSLCGNFDFSNAVQVTCQFAPVPAGQTLFIETESIYTQTTHGSDPVQVQITTDTLSGSTINIPMVQQPPFEGLDDYDGALGGRIWFPAGSVPLCSVSLSALGSGYYSCSISGYLAPAS